MRNPAAVPVALFVLAILALLAVLAARVNAAPAPAPPIVPLSDEPTDDDAAPIDDADDWLDLSAPRPVAIGLPGRLPRVTAAELARAAKQAPPVSAVVGQTYRAAGLADDPAPSWRVRSRLAGLVPTVSVRDGRDATWKDISDPTIGYVSIFSVAASWKLERLVFDPSELRISAIEAGRRRDRRRVAALAIRTYYAWLQLRAAAERDVRWQLRAEEAAAELDALTDGWFTRALPRNLPAPTSDGQAYPE